MLGRQVNSGQTSLRPSHAGSPTWPIARPAVGSNRRSATLLLAVRDLCCHWQQAERQKRGRATRPTVARTSRFAARRTGCSIQAHPLVSWPPGSQALPRRRRRVSSTQSFKFSSLFSRRLSSGRLEHRSARPTALPGSEGRPSSHRTYEPFASSSPPPTTRRSTQAQAGSSETIKTAQWTITYAPLPLGSAAAGPSRCEC